MNEYHVCVIVVYRDDRYIKINTVYPGVPMALISHFYSDVVGGRAAQQRHETSRAGDLLEDGLPDGDDHEVLQGADEAGAHARRGPQPL